MFNFVLKLMAVTYTLYPNYDIPEQIAVLGWYGFVVVHTSIPFALPRTNADMPGLDQCRKSGNGPVQVL